MSIEVTEDWAQYLIPLDERNLMQRGFGLVQTFEAAELIGIQFSLAPGTTGFDVWIDDIRFSM
jgi:hypothetical protein